MPKSSKQPIRSVEEVNAMMEQRHGLSPERQLTMLSSDAYDLLERRILDGTATSQEVCYAAKLGSMREQQERQILDLQAQLLKAKTDAIEAQKTSSEIYEKALQAMKSYSGHSGDDYDV